MLRICNLQHIFPIYLTMRASLTMIIISAILIIKRLITIYITIFNIYFQYVFNLVNNQQNKITKIEIFTKYKPTFLLLLLRQNFPAHLEMLYSPQIHQKPKVLYIFGNLRQNPVQWRWLHPSWSPSGTLGGWRTSSKYREVPDNYFSHNTPSIIYFWKPQAKSSSMKMTPSIMITIINIRECKECRKSIYIVNSK